MDYQAKRILRRSLDYYNDSGQQQQQELRETVKDKLQHSTDAADLIGFKSADSFTTAARVFLRITKP